ncbi:MAG TPA: glycosyltransferase family 1 protein, partial [Terracidiphilus sp.]|nr:glycosyltransferase family 1 protein [Terracidiphilus sp.]
EGMRVASWRSRMPPGYARYAMNALWTVATAPPRGRYDIYHATYQRWEPAIRHRVLVATHHDATQEKFPQLFRNAAAIRARKGRLYRRADMVICVSESARQDLMEIYGVAEGRTRLVHHGVTPIAETGPFEDGDARPYVLYVGARSPYKNFLALVRAFAKAEPARSMRLAVAGGGAWSDAERAAIGEGGLEDRILLLPRVDEARLGALYRGAALFVYPSLYEGFGLPPLEAMSAGCPVLVSRSSSLPEMCGDAAHYFDPAVDGSLEQELERLLGDRALLGAKVDAGHSQAGRYTWESAAVGTLAVYREALDRALDRARNRAQKRGRSAAPRG